MRRCLIASETRRVVLVIMHRWVGYVHGVQLGMAQYFQQRPHWVWTHLQPRPESLALVSRMKIDGVIAYVEHDYVNTLRRLTVPIVDVSNWVTPSYFPQVLADDRAIGRLAASYLRERGLRNFGMVGVADAGYVQLRSQGFAERLAEEGLTVDTPSAGRYRVPPGIHVPAGVDRDLLAFLLQAPKPLGLFGANDDYASIAIQACRHAGIRIPEDVCVLGCDDDELVTKVSSPPLSSIVLPTQKIGFEAARLLESLMDGNPAPAGATLFGPIGVITRQSTDLLAVDDEDVRMAVRYIRQHIHERINVRDLLRVIPVNRRYLERRFMQHMGRTPLQEIRRARIERAQELLAHTDLPMPTVAKQSGFANAERLANVFHTAVGTTPTGYRRRFALKES